MQSQVTIQILSALVKVLSADQLTSLGALSLNWPLAKLYSLAQGQAIAQSISHYLVHMELFQCCFTKDSTFNIIVNKASFFMFIMLNGRSALLDPRGGVISETNGNSSTICYVPEGLYHRKFSPGEHTMLLLTFREDYFIRRCAQLPAFGPLCSACHSAKGNYCILPHCAVAESIFNSFDKLFAKKTSLLKADVAIYGFIEDCLDKYHQALLAKRYDTNTIHKIKTAEIEQFIRENYTQKFADDLAKLASRFNLSRRTAIRLIKKQFGMPLHDYIVALRMQHAMKQLLTTFRTVKDIAAEVGYPDPLYFSKVFKKHYKTAPSDVKRP